MNQQQPPYPEISVRIERESRWYWRLTTTVGSIQRFDQFCTGSLKRAEKKAARIIRFEQQLQKNRREAVTITEKDVS